MQIYTWLTRNGTVGMLHENEKSHQGLGLKRTGCWDCKVKVGRRRIAMPNSIAGMLYFVRKKGSQSTSKENSQYKVLDLIDPHPFLSHGGLWKKIRKFCPVW